MAAATTKNTKKKVVLKKKTVGKTVAKVVTAMPAEVFTVDTNPPVDAKPDEVLLLTNQDNRGMVKIEGRTLGTFVNDVALQYGIRNFSVYVDNLKADTSMGNLSLRDVSKVEIVSKDQRGKV